MEQPKQLRPLLAGAGALVLLMLAIGIGSRVGKPAEQPSSPSTSAPTAGQEEPTQTTHYGVSYSPPASDPAKTAAFFTKAGEAGTAVTWAGDWQELGNPNAAPHVITQLANRQGLTPIVIVSVASDDNAKLIRPLTDTTQTSYIETIRAFAKKYQPAMLGVGLEINTLASKRPEDYRVFIQLFAGARTAIREVSPKTAVFPTFQLERMKGLNGGLFGGANNPAANQWELLNNFPDADMVGFTSYPALIYPDPDGIPDDYYTDIAAHTDKLVAFPELGWFRDGPTGWESNATEQATFIARFFTLTSSLSPRVAIWSFLYDQPVVPKPFDTAGLLTADQASSPAWDEWRRHSNRQE